MTAEAQVYSRYIRKQIASIDEIMAGMSEAQLNWKPPLPGGNSVFVIATHVLGNARAWVLGIACGKRVQRDRPAEFAASGPCADFHRSADALCAEIESSLAALEAGRLDVRLRPPQELWGAGEPQEMSVREALADVLEHASIHLGHVQLTRDLAAREVLR
jgi:hypothetical protein